MEWGGRCSDVSAYGDGGDSAVSLHHDIGSLGRTADNPYRIIVTHLVFYRSCFKSSADFRFSKMTLILKGETGLPLQYPVNFTCFIRTF